jgi:hypothetical protein
MYSEFLASGNSDFNSAGPLESGLQLSLTLAADSNATACVGTRLAMHAAQIVEMTIFMRQPCAKIGFLQKKPNEEIYPL